MWTYLDAKTILNKPWIFSSTGQEARTTPGPRSVIRYKVLTRLAQHADPGRSRPGFSKIYTPHNLLPQQNVREEAIVYCQSINNLDCWHKTDWSVKCLTIPHLKFCTRICSFVRGRETSLCFTYNHIMSQRPWVRFWGPKNVAASCTHLGPAQVMEVIIIDV